MRYNNTVFDNSSGSSEWGQRESQPHSQSKIFDALISLSDYLRALLFA